MDADRRRQAIALRLAGLSRAQIARALGITSSKALTAYLRGVPPPAWTRRPRAKDELRAEAIALRRQGRSYNEIAAVLPVSKSSLSLWLRDVLVDESGRERIEQRRIDARQRAASTNRALRRRREDITIEEARGEIGEVTARDLFIAGVVAYWAEGTKKKPWQASGRVSFVNSDPDMIRLFLSWLSLVGVEQDRLVFRLSIHESADVQVATAFWSEVVGVPGAEFLTATLKRHNPATSRKNVGVDYHGCLIVRVRRGAKLNRQITGWWQGICLGLSAGGTPGRIEGRSGMV